jgi:uncharacterized membrane protein YdjX (TVP38/TMEM64 family)
VLLLPGILFTTGAGFVLGVLEGSFYVMVATTLGAVTAFLIAQHAVCERARAFALSTWWAGKGRPLAGESSC